MKLAVCVLTPRCTPNCSVSRLVRARGCRCARATIGYRDVGAGTIDDIGLDLDVASRGP